ncbi:MAG: acetyl-CoA C-acyltransferase [Sandaracinaceae bacterium]|jgi:acetyl-CoA acyltransferase|nr:acetyl-CoA C-acyltransferase [Sandaracinaceae bacterium]
MVEAVILDAVRTPIGKHRGALSRVRGDDLAAHVISSLLTRNEGARSSLEEVILGATNQAGEDNRNVARMALLLAGLPYEVTGVTVNRLCGSGLEAVIQASRAIRLGDAHVMIAGGVESMTRAPYAMPKADEAFPRTPPPVYDTSLGWRFPNPRMAERFPLQSMGETAENVAEKYGVSRADQDAFAAESHRRAAAAWASNAFADEVVSVTTPPEEKGATAGTFARDESVRADASIEKLAKLQPVFRKGGSVTAGNSSPLNDGASGLLIASDTWAKDHGARPIARIVASAAAGVEPNCMGIGPVPATTKALARAGLKISDIDLIELNEAFAAQSLACVRELGLSPDKVNVNGGGIALGHPIGSSGARILGTLVHAMRKRGARLGLATLCIGVGQGLAVIVESIDS